MPRFDDARLRTAHDLPPPPGWRRWVALLALALVCAGVLWARIDSGRPQAVTEAGGAGLACVSYAPFHRPGESPFDPQAHVDRARIESDLRQLRTRTRCVRTYSVDQGLDAVPAAARALGMRVLLGAWIGRDRDKNEVELARAIALAREYRDTVDALIVGNEVLLRRELPPEVLADYLSRARQSSPVPVTYADVWEFWLRNATLAARTDFVTVHILPYWEDEPVAVDQAVRHVVSIAARVRDRFPGKRILIGETGWPSAGRQREGAVPSRVNQAEFVRRFVGAAADAGLDYNLIEAFDQPWKRRLEGAMGGSWGVLDTDAQPKFPWQGPVIENPEAAHGLVAAALGAALGLLIGFAARLGFVGALGAVLLLAPAATMLVYQWEYLQTWNRDALEWWVSGTWTLVGALVCAFAAPRIGQRLDGRPLSPVPVFARAAARRAGIAGLISIGRMLMLAGATAMAAMLVVDPRYRGFPNPLYLMPAVALATLGWLGDRPARVAAEERVLAAVLAALGVGIWINEGLLNREAIGFGLVMLALAGACWPRPARSAQRRASTSSEATAAAAAGSTE